MILLLRITLFLTSFQSLLYLNTLRHGEIYYLLYIWLAKFDYLAVFSKFLKTYLIIIDNSIASCRASASAVKVIFTTLFNFLDCQVSGIYLPFDPSKNIIKPPSEPLYFKFANEASLELINDELLRLSIFGNDNTTSLDGLMD